MARLENSMMLLVIILCFGALDRLDTSVSWLVLRVKVGWVDLLR
jgi:hypothetical protein